MSLVKECKQVRAAYLELRGGTVVTRWKRYWVVLNTDEIVYYSSPTTTVRWRKHEECTLFFLTVLRVALRVNALDEWSGGLLEGL